MEWDLGARTFWTVAFIGIFNWLVFYSSDQNVVQRYAAAKSTWEARKATIVYSVTAVSDLGLFLLSGNLRLRLLSGLSGSGDRRAGGRRDLPLFHFDANPGRGRRNHHCRRSGRRHVVARFEPQRNFDRDRRRSAEAVSVSRPERSLLPRLRPLPGDCGRRRDDPRCRRVQPRSERERRRSDPYYRVRFRRLHGRAVSARIFHDSGRLRLRAHCVGIGNRAQYLLCYGHYLPPNGCRRRFAPKFMPTGWELSSTPCSWHSRMESVFCETNRVRI